MRKHVMRLTELPGRIADFYNDEKDGRWLYGNRCYITVFFVLLLINVISAIPMKAPMIIDEYLTFSNSAFLSGRYDWSGTYSAVPGTPYYGYTQGLLYIPFFYLPISVYSVFKCALFMNACLMAFVPVAALYVVNQISEESGLNNTIKMFCALAVGSYSAYIYNSKGVWNETMLMLCPWLLASILFKLYNSQTQKRARIIWSIVLGGACIFYYALNSRALVGIVALACVLLFARMIFKTKMVNYVALALSGGGAYFIHKCIKRYLVSFLLLANGQGSIQNSSFNLSAFLKRIHIETLFMALKGYFGDIFYVFMASFSLTGIAIIWFLYLLFKAIKKSTQTTSANKQLIFSMFSILCLAGTWAMLFLVSYDTFALKEFTKQDAMMYGRYFDAIIPLTILSAISAFAGKEGVKSRIIFCGSLLSGIILLIGTVVTGGMMVEQNHLSAQPLNMGIPIAFAGKTYGGRTTWSDVWILFGAVVILSAVLVVLLRKNKYILGCCCLFTIYIYAAFVTLTGYCWPTSALQFHKYECYSEFFEGLEAKGIQYEKIYFLSNRYRDRGINIQYAVPCQDIEQIDYYLEGYRCLENIEENSIIISNEDVELDVFFDKMYLVENADFYIWSYGEELKRQFETQGYAVSGSNQILIGYDECALREIVGYTGETTAKALKGNYNCQVTISGKKLTNIEYESILYENVEDIQLLKYDEDEITVAGYMQNSDGGMDLSFSAKPSFSQTAINYIAVSNMESEGAFFTQREDLTMENSVAIGTGGILFGQYMTLVPGEYLVSVEGKYLNEAQFDYCWGKGVYVSDVADFVQKDEDKVTFVMSVDEVRDDMEIRVVNPSDQPIMIKEIIIQPILQEGRLQSHDAIGFCPIRMGVGDYFSRGEFLNSVYEVGGDFFYFPKDNGIAIKDVDLEPGEYCLEIHGEDVAVELQFLSEDGEYISAIETLEEQTGERGVTYTLLNKKGIENAQIIIQMLSTSEFITTPNSGIVKISEISLTKK